MNDPNTSDWTMGSSKKSVPQTIKDLEIEQGGHQVQIDEIKKDIIEMKQRIDRLFLFFHILWIVGGALGTLATIILSWLLGKI